MRLALYQPDIPQNLGTMLRLAACMGVGVDIIEPCGFPFDDTRVRRAGMDYIRHVEYRRHISWDAFWEQLASPARLVLLSTKAAVPYTQFQYQPEDVLLVGQESSGVPDEVHEAAQARVIIPMQAGIRSLNVAIAAAMVLGEAVRQTV